LARQGFPSTPTASRRLPPGRGRPATRLPGPSPQGFLEVRVPTYRLLPKEAARRRQAVAASPLSCERCGGVLGDAYTTRTRLRLPAADAIALWPELRQSIKRHEKECPGPRGPRAGGRRKAG